MKWILGGLGFVAALFVVDRVFLWLESRGWMYWRKTTSPPGDAISSAVLELQSFVDPKVRSVIEERADSAHRATRDDAGEPPEPRAR